MYRGNCMLYSVSCKMYMVHFTLFILHSTMYDVIHHINYTMCTIHSTMHSAYFTAYCTLYITCCMLLMSQLISYTILLQSILHSAHCTVHCRLYSLHCTAQFWGRNRFSRSTAAAAISRSPAVGLTRRPVRSSWLEVWLQNDGSWEREIGLN